MYYYMYTLCIRNYTCVYTYVGSNDYVSGPYFAVFPFGGMHSLPVYIFIIDDDIFETNESFSLTINPSSLPSRALVKPDCVLMITITDNDNG